MAAAYGVLPHTVVRLPWVQVRMIWVSYCKRQCRETRLKAALAGAELKTKGRADTEDTSRLSQLEASGFPVTRRPAQGG